ncbi:hypothetical protein AVEN_31492-1, partial [Araneus ventricosus]
LSLRWQAEWDNGETGRSNSQHIPKIFNKQPYWSRECIHCHHGPFPQLPKRFGLHSTDYCGCGEIDSFTMQTRCPLTLSYHHKEPRPTIHSPLVEERPHPENSQDGNIDNLITFLRLTQKPFQLKVKIQHRHIPCLEIDTPKDYLQEPVKSGMNSKVEQQSTNLKNINQPPPILSRNSSEKLPFTSPPTLSKQFHIPQYK